MPYCENCGTKLSGGTCPNCEEELYIFENQSENLPEDLSEEFVNKTFRQLINKEIRQTKRIIYDD